MQTITRELRGPILLQNNNNNNIVIFRLRGTTWLEGKKAFVVAFQEMTDLVVGLATT